MRWAMATALLGVCLVVSAQEPADGWEVDQRRLALPAAASRALGEAGIVAELNVYEGMSHAGYRVVPESPESLQAYKELNEFLLTHLGG